MDAPAYLRRQFARVWRLGEAILGDLTAEQLNRAPPGTANPIGLTLAHVLADDDLLIRTVLQGCPRLWDAEGWGARLGMATPPLDDQGWGGEPTPLDLATVLGYGQGVRAAAEAYLAGLTAEELERRVVLDGEEQLVVEVLAMVVAHTLLHLGEVAALKGAHGARGLPW